MLTRNLLRNIFRHGPRERFNEDTLPLGLKLQVTEPTTNTTHETANYQNNQRSTTPNTRPLPPKTPEPFGLEDILEVDTRPNTPSVTESEAFAWFELEISTFSTRELVHATLYEAKSAASSHLDTINTTLSLLEALKGFSATISELRGEMLEKKQACDEQMATLDAVERSLEKMTFAGKTPEQEHGHAHVG